jgi:predicted ATPase/DNA-binding CsgD family transcriptional regulator
VSRVPLTLSDSLAIPATPFIGRHAELRTVCDLLRRDGVRLVTLTGVGGSGKTRLAMHVAAELATAFADGAVFVDLAPVSDSALVAPTIAHRLGDIDARGHASFDAIVECIRDQRRLLVLDNFEQVLGAVGIVDDLLRACPGVSVLVTSRAPLQIRAEREFPVPPLKVPDATVRLSLNELSQFEAIALFVDRATAIRPDFALTESNAAAVVEICSRLDGLPLAIELATARLRLLSPEAILPRLGLDLLGGGRRDLPARHQTLRTGIAWSYDLLSERQQMLFRRLSVFVGGFTLAAAAAVCGMPASEETLVLEEVGALVDNNLVRSAGFVAGEQRYSMLETIREFGSEQLQAHDEAPVTRSRHLAWYLDRAEQQRSPTPHGLDLLARFDAEFDNFRAALRWSCSGAGDPELGLRMVAAIDRMWNMRGHFVEARAWLDRLLPLCKQRTAARASALTLAGFLATRQNDDVSATPLFEEALDIRRELGDSRGLATTLYHFAVVPHHQGDHRRAQAMLEESLAIARAARHQGVVEMGLLFLADLVLDRGDFSHATRLYNDALAVARPRGNTHSIAYGVRGLGHVARAQGQYTRAHQLLTESLQMFAELRDQRCVPLCLEGLACIAVGPDWAERAARLLGAAHAYQKKTGAPAPPSELADYLRTEADARAELGDERFGAMWAQGADMAFVEAVGYALTDAAPTTVTPRVRTRVSLSPRERQVVALIAGGLSNGEIAGQLVLSVRTVERHIENVYNRLGIRGKAGRAIVTAYSLRHHLIESG